MSTKLKKIFITLVLLVFSVVVPSTTVFAMSKSDVKKNIKKLEKEVSSLSKKTTKSVPICGEAVSYNPLIIKDITGGFYYVNDDTNLTCTLFVYSGRVKLTGETFLFEYNGNFKTSYVCNSVKKSKSEKTLESKKTKLQNYKNALKDKYNMSSIDLVVGEEDTIDGEWDYGGKYNTLTFTSSDTNVVKVDKKGNIKAVGEGEAKIYAKASVSGKKTYCMVYVEAIDDESASLENGVLYVSTSLLDSFHIDEKNVSMIRKNNEAIYVGDNVLKTEDEIISYDNESNIKIEIHEVDVLNDTNVVVSQDMKDLNELVMKDIKEFENPYAMEIYLQDKKVSKIVYTYNAS